MTSSFKAYTGKILDIDLSRSYIGEYEVNDTDRELFLGGRFLSTKILWDLLKPGTDPLSPDNILIIMTSPLTGTNAPSSSRYDISARSPLTGAIGHSNSGGNFGITLKRSGFDGIIVRGRAAKPVYIDIDAGSAKIMDASHLWNMNTHDAQEAMGKGGTMAIGPAGENLVKYATIVSQERCHGRTGMGAVMGSKNIKGMVARGGNKIELDNEPKFKELIKKWTTMLKAHPATGDFAPRFGTAGFLTTLSSGNALPTKNFTSGTYKDAYKIGGERLANEFLVKNYGCVSCPIRCGRVVKIDGKEVKGPEYEILSLLGSNMMINDIEKIIQWNYELDLLGIDTISVGTVFGFAAELNEKKLWDNGIEFGKSDNISALIKDIAFKQGIGAELAEGVRYLSKKYGGKDFAPHVKGLELAAYEPRSSVGHGLGYATAPRGACHLDGGYMIYFEVTGPVTLKPLHYRSKSSWTILDQNLLAAISAGGNCLFTSWTFVPTAAFKLTSHFFLATIVRWLLTHAYVLVDLVVKMPKKILSIHLPMLPHTKAISLATGMKMNFGRYYLVGDRGFNLERLFNLREGIGKESDSMATRFTEEELVPGNSKTKLPLDKMLPKYYRLRGWDKNGIPKKRTLKKLGLDFASGSVTIKN